MKLKQNTEEKLLQSPQLYQQMNILSMSSIELEKYINDLSMENPLIEPPLNSYSISIRSHSSNQVGYSDSPIPDECPFTLKSDLEEQMLSMKLDSETAQILKLLVINLDQRGYLPKWISGSVTLNQSDERFKRAVELLKSMDPAGVGAKDLSECLMLQLERVGQKDSLAYRICDGYLEYLSKYRINFLAQEFSVSEAEVIEANEIIKSLSPIPSNGYNSGSCGIHVIPDAEIVIMDNTPKLKITEHAEPNIRISSFYMDMLKSDLITEQERTYFKAKLTQAQWVVDAIKQRQETLKKCCLLLLEHQREYFLTGESLKPCSMSGMAKHIGVHPSTISRTVKDKYLACKWGVFPISYFFANEVNGATSAVIIEELKRIIKNEDSSKPLSDSKLCDELSKRGYNVARRTVAKYRELVNIPPATGRKKR